MEKKEETDGKVGVKMRFKTQDPKYDIEVAFATKGGSGGEVVAEFAQGAEAYLVNALTGKRVDMDIPIFMLLGKDIYAMGTVQYYMSNLVPQDGRTGRHAAIVGTRLGDFARFAIEHPERMKEPDTEPK